MTEPLPPSDRRQDESDDLPEARLRAAAADRIDDNQPESRLEAPPGRRRVARSAEDLLKEPHPDPGLPDQDLAP